VKQKSLRWSELREIRDLAADRPDATESPITVDRGFWQIESSVFDFSRDDGLSGRTETLTFGEINLKYGVSDNIDLQLIWAPYIFEEETVSGETTTTEDSSDITLRLKWNLWGNDGGDSAFALFPFVTIPTGSDFGPDRWEG